MNQDINLLAIETILDRLDIDLKKIEEGDATQIVGIILLYMIEEAARSIENTEIPIADMLWVASE